MFKLTLLLCATIFVALLIGGEDRGQLRPGLASAMLAPEDPPPPAPVAQEEPIVVTAAESTPDTAPATAPVVVEARVTDLVVTDQPIAEPVDAEVFSLATFSEATAPTETPATTEQAGRDIAVVSARSVNVRSGPGTDFAVLTRLGRGEAVTRIGDAGNGWALIRIEGDGVEGYISTAYLAAP